MTEILERAIEQIDALLADARSMEAQHRELVDSVHADQRQGARNLLHYLALRRRELPGLQRALDRAGLTDLTSDLAHVTASLTAVRHALRRLRGDDVPEPPLGAATPQRFAEGHTRLRTLAAQMLGAPEDGSMPAIMVTMPCEAALESAMVRDMVAAGMTCARINCTQDDVGSWSMMADNVRAAAAELGRPCRVFMDLGGPRMRTGPMPEGPRVLRVRPPKDDRGYVIHAVPVALVAQVDAPTLRASGYDATTQRYWTFAREGWLEPWIPLAEDFLSAIEPGHRLQLSDARGHRAELPIVRRPNGSLCALSSDRLYLETGLDLELVDAAGEVVAQGAIGTYPPLSQKILLRVGDELMLEKEMRPGEEASFAPDGTVIEPARISCTVPEVLPYMKVGERLLLDDGKIRAVVKENTDRGLLLEITNARPGGTRLQANKGINVPDSDIGLRGLTPTDLDDLEFIVRHADAVEMSFVNSPLDVLDLYERLDELGADDIDVVLKIETRSGFKNLPGILLAAMRRPRVGLMIARGDLAVEVGWRNLARLQEEMVSLAEAAHVPVIWATQVLERMAKTGQPTRAELTDVSMAHRAECVMLNKGPFLVETIRGLHTLMSSAARHQAGKSRMLGALEFAELDIEPDRVVVSS